MEFAILGEAFHEMAKAGVAQLRRTRPDGRYWQSIGSNYAGFPIVYNYRHVFELYLKGMLITAEPALTFPSAKLESTMVSSVAGIRSGSSSRRSSARSSG